MQTKDLIIIGAGGFASEVAWLVNDINSEQKTWNLLGFIDEDISKKNMLVCDYPILGDFSWFSARTWELYVAIAIGSPFIRKQLLNKLIKSHVKFPNIIHPSVKKSNKVNMNAGNIVCANSILTTNITIGSFNIINLSCTVGHDVIIEDFCTLAPAVNLSGYSYLCEGCELGTNSCVIPHKKIGKWSIIGAGSVVIDDIESYCTAVGSPARKIKQHIENEEDTL